METAEILTTLRGLPLGARLLVRSRTDWRTAVVCRAYEEKVVLSVCSPTGRTYRLHRDVAAEIVYDGILPILKQDLDEDWRDNFSRYDARW